MAEAEKKKSDGNTVSSGKYVSPTKGPAQTVPSKHTMDPGPEGSRTLLPREEKKREEKK